MVRTHYIPVDEHVFRSLFNEGGILHGGRYNDDIRIFSAKTPYIRGSGWFSRLAIPLIKNIYRPKFDRIRFKFFK